MCNLWFIKLGEYTGQDYGLRRPQTLLNCLFFCFVSFLQKKYIKQNAIFQVIFHFRRSQAQCPIYNPALGIYSYKQTRLFIMTMYYKVTSGLNHFIIHVHVCLNVQMSASTNHEKPKHQDSYLTRTNLGNATYYSNKKKGGK